MKYNNYKCDSCQKQFDEKDDIVVCPECGTPQHRDCYNLKGECVNAAKHGTGYSWIGEHKSEQHAEPERKQSESDKKDPIVCPTCGCENEPGSERCSQCGQKFTVFGINIVERNQELEKEEMKRLGESETDENQPELERLINARVRALAPGITDEQKKERLCGQTICDTVAFIGNSAGTYVKKFRKIERENKRTFNWGAFFFTPCWFFFRKLYKPGIIFLTISLALSIISISPSSAFQSFISSYTTEQLRAMTQAEASAFMEQYTSLMIPIAIISIIQLIVNIVAGLIADRMYKKYCETSLEQLDNLRRNEEYDDEDLVFFVKKSSTSFFWGTVVLFAVSFLPGMLTTIFTGL